MLDLYIYIEGCIHRYSVIAGVDAAYAALVETRSKLRAAAKPPPV